MEKDRSGKIIAVIALVVALVGVSIGFAAFSKDLNINVSGNVVTDPTEFNVQFSELSNGLTAGNAVTQTAESTGEGSAAIRNGSTTIEDVTATFENPGDTVILEFYVVNASDYIAYLKTIKFGQAAPTCQASQTNGATQNITGVCGAMTMNISVGTNSANYTTSDIADTGLTVTNNNSIDAYNGTTYDSEKVTLTLTYGDVNSVTADGSIDVDFGDITLTYSTAN